MPRSCAPLAEFAKGTEISEFRVQRQQFGCGFLPNVTMKRMKQSVALVLAFCVIASSASANLGDNSERIEDAYGTIVQRRLRDDGTVSVVYVKGRYLYLVTFADRRFVRPAKNRQQLRLELRQLRKAEIWWRCSPRRAFKVMSEKRRQVAALQSPASELGRNSITEGNEGKGRV